MAFKLAVMGGGSWGTTVASLVARNAEVMLWARDSGTVDDINQNHRNSRYLGDAALHASLRGTTDPEQAVAGADAVIMGIPSDNFRNVLSDIAPLLPGGVPLISLTKGLERGSKLRMTEVCREVAPGRPVGLLTGPNLAREIMAGQAAASVLALDDPAPQAWLQPLLNVGLFRVYTNPDHVGCELGGVFKNIIAIAVGMGDGLGAGDNTRAALITRGLAEMTRLGTVLGGRPETFAGLAGMGDMIATCTSPQSRNRHVGIELAKGHSIDAIIDSMHMVAEGVKSAPTVIELAQEHDLDMPISQDVFKVVTGAADARGVYRGLLRTRAAAESEPG